MVFLAGAAACTSGQSEPASDGSTSSSAAKSATTGTPTERGGDGAGDADPLVWVAVEGAQQVVAVDLDRREVVSRTNAPAGPHNATRGPNGGVVTTVPDAGQVALVDRDGARFVDLGGSPHDVKPYRDGYVVANEGAARLDLLSPSGEVEGQIGLTANPHDVAVAPDGITVWATLDGTDELAVVDLDAREVTRYVSTGESPHDLLFAPDGRLWVTDWAGELHVLTPDGGIDRSIPLGAEAHHLAFSRSAGEAWIADHGTAELFVLDIESVAVLDRVPLPGAPHHVALTTDGSRVVVADHDNGTLLLYDASAREQVATIPVGPGPHGVAVAPAS